MGLVFLFGQCYQDKTLITKIDGEKASIQLMRELAPQLTGTWNMKNVQVKYQNSAFHRELNIKQDTILTNLATLTIAPASAQISPTSYRYEGKLRYKDKFYPVRFDLLAGPWIYDKKGAKAFFLLENNYTVGTSFTVEKDEYFLQQIGLMFENFSLEIADRTMTWHGLNRGIEKLVLVKN